MRLILIVPLMLATGCASTGNDAAICDGTQQARADHAAALIDSDHDKSVLTGARLLALMKAGCG